MKKIGFGILLVLLASGILLAWCGCCTSVEGRIRSVETGLSETYDAPDRSNILDRMAHHGVPGVGIAVVDDFELQWAKGYGVLEAGGRKAVTPDTLFQVASLGKSVVAATVLLLAEEGRVSLDRGVDEMLTSWRLPENEFTAAAPVTLRRLLSHTAGTTLHGFRGYARGEPVPTLRQILDGAPPANSPPIRIDVVPGTVHRYSGGGYMIVQQVLEDVTETPFSRLVHDRVFAPLEMTSCVFDPLPRELHANAARGHREGGRPIVGGWHTYPEMGAGPFWSTASDMARFLIDLMRAYEGKPGTLLSRKTAVAMLTPVLGEYGLGLGVGDDGGDRFYGIHRGANDGYQTLLVVYPKRGQAAVILTSSDTGQPLAREILNSLSREYGWVSGFFR